MNQRIRYNKTSPAVYESKTSYVATNSMFKVYLNTNDNSFSIVNIETQDIAATGTSKKSDLTSLKIAAKLALAKLGVVFKTEKRVRLKKMAQDLRELGVTICG